MTTKEAIDSVLEEYKEYILYGKEPQSYSMYDIVDQYEETFNMFLEDHPKEQFGNKKIVCNLMTICPECGEVVLSSKGVKLMPEELIGSQLTEGMSQNDLDFLNRYKEEVCYFMWHCPRCSHAWQSCDAYADLEEAAWVSTCISEFMKQKGSENE